MLEINPKKTIKLLLLNRGNFAEEAKSETLLRLQKAYVDQAISLITEAKKNQPEQAQERYDRLTNSLLD